MRRSNSHHHPAARRTPWRTSRLRSLYAAALLRDSASNQHSRRRFSSSSLSSLVAWQRRDRRRCRRRRCRASVCVVVLVFCRRARSIPGLSSFGIIIIITWFVAHPPRLSQSSLSSSWTRIFSCSSANCHCLCFPLCDVEQSSTTNATSSSSLSLVVVSSLPTYIHRCMHPSPFLSSPALRLHEERLWSGSATISIHEYNRSVAYMRTGI